MPTAVGSCWVVAVLRPWPRVLWFLCFPLSHNGSTAVLGFCHPEIILGQRLPDSMFIHHLKGGGVGTSWSPTLLCSTSEKQNKPNHNKAGTHSAGSSSEHRCVYVQWRELILTQINNFPIRLAFLIKSKVRESRLREDMAEVMAFGKRWVRQ